MSDAGASAAAEDAAAEVVENTRSLEQRLRRLRSAVQRNQAVVDELADATERVDEKYAKFEQLLKGKPAELREAKKMQADARRALKEAEAALADYEEGA